MNIKTNQEYKDRCGERIRQSRRKQDVTAAELAKAVGLTPSAISSYERKESYPTAESIDRISQHLHLDKCWLAGLVDHEYQTPSTIPSSVNQSPVPMLQIEKTTLMERKINADNLLQFECSQNNIEGISNGDIVLVDQNQTVKSPGGLYLIDPNNDQENYLTLTPEESHKILGRVVSLISFHRF